MRTLRLAVLGLSVVALGTLSVFGVSATTGPRKVDVTAAVVEPPAPPAEAFRRYGTLPPSPAGTPGDVLFSPDGKEVGGFVTMGQYGWFDAWDVASGERRRHLVEPASDLYTGAYGRDGRHFLTASLDDTLLVWDFDTGGAASLAPLLGPGRPALIVWQWNVKVSSDVRTVAVPAPFPGADTYVNGIVLREVASGRKRGELVGSESKWATAFAFSPDNRYLLGAVADGCVVWDLATGKIVNRLAHTKGARGGAFAPDGRNVAVAGEFSYPKLASYTEWQRVKFIDLATGWTRHCTYKDHQNDGEKAAAYSPDGRLVATLAMRTPQVCLWDPATGDLLATVPYPSPGYFVGGVAFAPDGKSLAVNTSFGNVLMWDLTRMPFWKNHKAAPAPPLAGLHSSTETLSKEDLDKVWDDLAADDGARAYRATWAVALHGADAVSLLRKRLRPADGPKPEVVARLLADLDADDYATRRRAAPELKSLAHLFVPELRAAQKSSTSAEVRHRLGDILDELPPQPVTDSETLRSLHAVEALEHMGGPDAIGLLRRMAKGAPAAPETRQAKFALQRLSAN